VVQPITLSESEGFVHRNYATNTIRIWTDGGYKEGVATAAVYAGDHPTLQERINVVHGESSFIGELVAILIALQKAPTNTHLEVITDCTSAITAINNYGKWKKGRQANTKDAASSWPS